MTHRYLIELFDPCTLEKLAGFRSSDLKRARRTALNAVEDGMHARVTDLRANDGKGIVVLKRYAHVDTATSY